MKYKELGKLGFTFVKGINPNKSDEGNSYLIPSGAIFPLGINLSKTHKIITTRRDVDKILFTNDILFNTGGEGTIGRSCLFNINSDLFYVDGFVVVIRQNSELIDPKFVFYCLSLSKTINQIANLKDGTTGITSIKVSNIKKLLIPVFEFDEQNKISEILSKIDKAILQTKEIIAKYTLVKTGLLQDLLTKGIDKKGNVRSEETHKFKDSPLGRIPDEWDFLPIANVYNLKSGITPLRSNKKYFSREGHNWVKTLDLNEDYLYETEEKVSDYALDNTSLKLMPVNSILIAMYGGWEQIGRTSILKKEAGTNQAITCLSNPKFEMNSDFVQLLLQYYRFKWKQFAVSTRKDPNITKTDIENFILTFPKDIEEQNNIADKINSIKENISLNEIELNKLKSIKKGLMQDLLSGKKRVTHLIN